MEDYRNSCCGGIFNYPAFAGLLRKRSILIETGRFSMATNEKYYSVLDIYIDYDMSSFKDHGGITDLNILNLTIDTKNLIIAIKMFKD